MRRPTWLDGQYLAGAGEDGQQQLVRRLGVGGVVLALAATLVAAGGGGGTAHAAPATAATTATTRCHVVDTNSDQSYTNLQDAVNAASTGDTLFVKGTCTGTTTIGTSLTIDGQSASGRKSATLDGGGQGPVLTVYVGATVTLNTLIITDGHAEYGGGITNTDGTLTLNESTVTGNTASEAGGGIFNTDGTLTLNESTVSGNTASVAGGGVFSDSTVTLNDGSTISGNTASEDGGGIFNIGTLTMTGSSTITGNTTSGQGGGIYNSCGGTLNGPVAGGNVYDNTPDQIYLSTC